ncbi:MAG: hypothetical protein LBV15_01920, partial [Planctomycetota bacterium]|nr:hypothetical protein [Planctomycetota bacterium]
MEDSRTANPGLRRLALGLALAVAGLAAYLYVSPPWRLSDPLSDRLGFDLPAQAATIPDGGLAAIDAARRRLVRLDADGVLLYSL